MNDFSELEAELKKLRPAAISTELSARIERRLHEAMAATATAGILPKGHNFRVNWFALGLGLAAAAAFLILARVTVQQRPVSPQRDVASITPAPSAPMTAANNNFVPAGLTQVVYHTRDEGLLFRQGADQPVRRLRSRAQETLQWRNPETGASLRVSYPSEEVTLVPVPGQ